MNSTVEGSQPVLYERPYALLAATVFRAGV